MGVDCRITLPPYVQVKNVAKVLGVLFGLTPERKNFSHGNGDGWYAVVPGVKVESCDHDASYCKILIDSPMFDYTRYTLYFFEWDTNGNRGMNPGADTIWQLAGKRLVEIFGGSVDYCDSDEIDSDFSAPQNSEIVGRDDGSFDEMQRIIMDLQPITKKDLECFEQERAQKAA